MLEKKNSNFVKKLIYPTIKVLIIIWTFYLLTFLIFDEMYKDEINCQDKNPDNCEKGWYAYVKNLVHPFNFNRYRLDDMGLLGGYINLGLILVIIILSCILLFSSNTHITLEYKYMSFILITIICLIYHMINWISSL